MSAIVPGNKEDIAPAIGSRQSFADAHCTVRYIGPLQGHKGVFVGVEWDDPSLGKHSGTLDGKFYFQSAIELAGSFFRIERPKDATLGIWEAIKSKYIDIDMSIFQNKVIVGGKTIDIVGFNKARQTNSIPITTINLDDMPVVEDIKTMEEVLDKFPPELVVEFNLANTLVSNISNTIECIRPFRHIQTLNLSNNRFTQGQTLHLRLENLSHLLLNNTDIQFDVVLNLTQHLPALKILEVRSNNWNDLLPIDVKNCHTVEQLDVSDNLISSRENFERLLNVFTG